MPCPVHSFATSRFALASSASVQLSSSIHQSAFFSPAGLAVAAFALIMAVSTIQFLRGRAWFLWTLVLASMLETAGFVATAIHIQESTNHVAFLASYSTITLAPILLSIANYTTYGRLAEWVTPQEVRRSSNIWTRLCLGSIQFNANAIVLVLPLLGFGLWNLGQYLSPAPIDGPAGAVARLAFYETSVTWLWTGHLAQLIVAGFFAIAGLVFQIKSSAWKVDSYAIGGKNWRSLLYTINAVNGLVLLRTLFKVIELTNIRWSDAQLAGNGPLFWLFDALPMLVALVFFCAIKPTSYLPQDMPAIVLDASVPYVDEKKILIDSEW